MVEHVEQAKGHHPHHVRAERQQEQEEVAVVAASNAVVDPGTVVVKVLAGAGCQNAWRIGTGHRASGERGGVVTSTQLSQTLQCEQRGGR